MYISADQKRLLGKIKRKSRLKSKLNNRELRDLTYLGDNGLIQYETLYEDEQSPKKIGTLVLIQPKGNAVYDQICEERRKWLIPVIISVAALIISICAIVSSSQSVNVYIDGQKNARTTQTTSAAAAHSTIETSAK